MMAADAAGDAERLRVDQAPPPAAAAAAAGTFSRPAAPPAK